jgi:hypothetical protein
MKRFSLFTLYNDSPRGKVSYYLAPQKPSLNLLGKSHYFGSISRDFFLFDVWVMEQEQIERLAKLSAKTRVPKSVYIRDGVDFILDKCEKQLKGKRKKREGR